MPRVSIDGTGGGAPDGDLDTFPEALEFSLDSNPITSLIGGRKRTDAGGLLDALGADSVTIVSGVSASNMVGRGVQTVVIGHDVTADNLGGVCIGSLNTITSSAIGSVNIGYNNGAAGSGSLTSVVIGANNTPGGNNNIIIGSENTTSASTDSIAIGRAISHTANGDGYISIGQGTSISSGGFNIVIGKGAACFGTADESIAIGHFSDARAPGAIAFGSGSVAGVQANNAGAIGIGGDDGILSAPSITADNATGIGSGVAVNIASTWQIHGFGSCPAAAAVVAWERLAGAQIVLVSPDIDATGTSNNRFDFPSDVHFFCDQVDILVTELTGAETVQGTYRMGNRNVADAAGDNEFFVPATAGTNLNTVFGRDIISDLSNQTGVTSVNGDITIASDAATSKTVRFAFKGYLLRDE